VFELIAIFFWLVGLALQVGIAILLYRLGEQRFDSGVIWGIAGFIFGVFAVITFFLFVWRTESMERTKARSEFGRIKGVLQHHKDTADEFRAATTTNMDPEIDALIAAKRLEEAAGYTREKLRVAYEMGDDRRVEMYRRYQEIINTQADWPGER